MIASDRPRGAPLLEVEGIGKSFGGVPVLENVGFSLEAGRVLGLVGENGAGKSTLMNVLGGVLAPDAGRMTLGGEDYRPRTPAEAAARGIAFIHQELNLHANLSIAENLFLARLPAPALHAVPRPRVARAPRARGPGRRWGSRCRPGRRCPSSPRASGSSWRSPGPWPPTPAS